MSCMDYPSCMHSFELYTDLDLASQTTQGTHSGAFATTAGSSLLPALPALHACVPVQGLHITTTNDRHSVL